MAQNQEYSSIQKTIVNGEAQTTFSNIFGTTQNENQYYAPFLAKAKRFGSSKLIQNSPPIGTYNLPSCFDRKKLPFQDRVSHFILEAQKKKEEMCIFKSSLNRFNKIKKQNPGPASYNLFRIERERKQQIPVKEVLKQKKSVQSPKTCPSIPFKQNKFGYSMANGKYKMIQKNQQQIQNEKESRKQYVGTLVGEKSFRKDYQSGNYHNLNLKKKLYDTTNRIIAKEGNSQHQAEKSSPIAKKPKYEHLYNSKGVPVDYNYKFLGPGQYQINSSQGFSSKKKQKFQFFGSTEIRFRHKIDPHEKGYSLIQMIKEGKNLKQYYRKSPIKKPVHNSSENIHFQSTIYPGPGQYDPNDVISKKIRGTTVFLQSERFKEMYPEKRQMLPQQNQQNVRYNERKSVRTGTLKKQRFKQIHRTYEPIEESKIYGILSESKASVGKQNKLGKQQLKRNEQSPQINCWSRQDKRNKVVIRASKGYMKELKQQLALITDTPRLEEISKIHLISNKQIKKQ